MRSSIDAPILANQNLAAASTIFSWALKEDLPGSRSTPASVSSVTRPPVAREYYQIASCLRFWSAFDDAGLIRSMALKMTRTGHGHSRTSTHNSSITIQFPQALGVDLEQRARRAAAGSYSGGGCCGSCRLIGID